MSMSLRTHGVDVYTIFVPADMCELLCTPDWRSRLDNALICTLIGWCVFLATARPWCRIIPARVDQGRRALVGGDRMATNGGAGAGVVLGVGVAVGAGRRVVLRGL
jgi:hypothetical protein